MDTLNFPGVYRIEKIDNGFLWMVNRDEKGDVVDELWVNRAFFWGLE